MATIDDELRAASHYLKAHDPKLAPVIRRAGRCRITPHSDYYGALVSSIIGQQLSVRAAHAIRQRFMALFGGVVPSPHTLLKATPEALRQAGLSTAKAAYVHDLARHIIAGGIRFEQLQTQTNEEIIAELCAVKGIGEWTAHMFLMFCMGRLDVLANGDLGIRNGVRSLYGLASVPAPAQVTAIAEKYDWHPYESVACWYVWRSLESLPLTEQDG